MPETTHIQKRKNAAVSTMQQVIELLEWSQEKYCWHKYLTGLEYLNRYTQGDAEAIGWLENQKMFWNWWKNHWTIREEQFILSASKMKHRINREVLYMGMNNANSLANEICPNGVLLGESYAVMIGTLKPA
ncbi:MAG: hypothetical protein ACK4EY_14500 [Flavipsychrobacter sp.]